jgi:exonuclease III
MILLSWNIRGLGNLRIVSSFHQLVKEKKPSLVFLMETCCSKKHVESLRVQLGYVGVFVVDPVGRSGGLALFWKDSLKVEIFNYSRHHINAIVQEGEDDFRWKLTGFYGQPDTARREESWTLLRHLKSIQPTHWLCVGDFNEILEQ